MQEHLARDPIERTAASDDVERIGIPPEVASHPDITKSADLPMGWTTARHFSA